MDQVEKENPDREFILCSLIQRGQLFYHQALEFSVMGKKSSPHPPWPHYSEWSKVPSLVLLTETQVQG